jgi:ketosteroid isomerase-like protein
MSRANVEAVRRAYEAFNTRDISRWLAMHSADAELHNAPPSLIRKLLFQGRNWGSVSTRRRSPRGEAHTRVG